MAERIAWVIELPRILKTLTMLLATCALSAQAEQNGIRKCRELTEPAAKLACYEALPLSIEDRPTPASPESGSRPFTSAGAKNTTDGPIVTFVRGDFSGWRANERIELDNGQIWQVVDGSTYATSPGRRVATIRSGMLGAQFIDIEGIALAPRVRRIK
jgi:hypothetical protein